MPREGVAGGCNIVGWVNYREASSCTAQRLPHDSGIGPQDHI